MNKVIFLTMIFGQFFFRDVKSLDYILTKRFDSPKIFYDKNNKRIPAPESENEELNEVETRGIVGDVKGFLKSGRCLMVCIWNNPKNCMGMTLCGWKCIVGNDVPPPEAVEMQSQDDDDIISGTPDTGPDFNSQGGGLTPTSIVNFFIQFVNCIGKYKPYNKIGLKRFTICIINRAFCKSRG